MLMDKPEPLVGLDCPLSPPGRYGVNLCGINGLLPLAHEWRSPGTHQ